MSQTFFNPPAYISLYQENSEGSTTFDDGENSEEEDFSEDILSSQQHQVVVNPSRLIQFPTVEGN
jgi:hypothetical protein